MDLIHVKSVPHRCGIYLSFLKVCYFYRRLWFKLKKKDFKFSIKKNIYFKFYNLTEIKC